MVDLVMEDAPLKAPEVVGSRAGVSPEREREEVRDGRGIAVDGQTLAQPFSVDLQQENADAKSKSDEVIPELVLFAEETAILDSFKAERTKLTVLGQFQGETPGQERLKEWAKVKLHKSLVACPLIGNGFFEAQFSSPDGVHDCLWKVFTYEGREVTFSPWNARFSPDCPGGTKLLEYPVWLQFLGLSEYLRNPTCLKILAGKYGRVLFVEESENYAAKTAGLRTKILISDSSKITDRIRLRVESGVYREHKILVTGHPNQCTKCSQYGYTASHCPGVLRGKLKTRRNIFPRRAGTNYQRGWQQYRRAAEDYRGRTNHHPEHNRDRDPDWRGRDTSRRYEK